MASSRPTSQKRRRARRRRTSRSSCLGLRARTERSILYNARMSRESARAFLDALNREPRLLSPGDTERQQVTLSVNGLIELGAGRGFVFTQEEIRDALAERAAQAATGELNSSELDAVSGGTDHDAVTASRFQISIDGYQNATSR